MITVLAETAAPLDQVASFGVMWLVACIIAAPLIVFMLARGTVKLLKAAAVLVWGTAIAALVFLAAVEGNHDAPALAGIFAWATGLSAEYIVPPFGRGLKTVFAGLVKRMRRETKG